MKKLNLCESCGMPLRKKEDFGGGKENNRYCLHCCDETGNLKEYEEVLIGMTVFVVKTMGISENEARNIAIGNMTKMKAWKKIKSV